MINQFIFYINIVDLFITYDIMTPHSVKRQDSTMCTNFKKELQDWQELCEDLAVLKEQEANLRRKLFDQYFPDPKSGVNTISFPNKFKLKGTPKMNVSVDHSMLETVGKKLGAEVMDKLIKWKPEPINKEVKLLSERQRKIFDQTLVMKPGMPKLELIGPKA